MEERRERRGCGDELTEVVNASAFILRAPIKITSFCSFENPGITKLIPAPLNGWDDDYQPQQEYGHDLESG